MVEIKNYGKHKVCYVTPDNLNAEAVLSAKYDGGLVYVGEPSDEKWAIKLAAGQFLADDNRYKKYVCGYVFVGDAKYVLDDNKYKKFIRRYEHIKGKNPWIKNGGNVPLEASCVYSVKVGKYNVLCADLGENAMIVQDRYIINSGVVSVVPVQLVDKVKTDVPGRWFTTLSGGILTIKKRCNGEIDTVYNGVVLETFNKGGIAREK
jgi:hypothetical protein